MKMTLGSFLSHPLRRARSASLRALRRVASWWRVGLARIGNGQVVLPWSTMLGSGVVIKVTDGGSLVVGVGVEVGSGSVLIVQAGSLRIGNDVSIAHGCTIVARESIVLGNDALIAEQVSIRDQDHRMDEPSVIRKSGFVTAPIEIGADVWIGAKASVLRGSKVGAHAVIGAHALIRGVIPANSVAVGVPARVIRARHTNAGS